MSARLKVERMLKDEHWTRFQGMVVHPRTSVDDAHQWLTDRGYTISRNAVWRFWRRSRASVGSLEFASDVEARRKGMASLKVLSGQKLMTAAALAVFMANHTSGVKGSVRRPV